MKKSENAFKWSKNHVSLTSQFCKKLTFILRIRFNFCLLPVNSYKFGLEKQNFNNFLFCHFQIYSGLLVNEDQLKWNTWASNLWVSKGFMWTTSLKSTTSLCWHPVEAFKISFGWAPNSSLSDIVCINALTNREIVNQITNGSQTLSGLIRGLSWIDLKSGLLVLRNDCGKLISTLLHALYSVGLVSF